MTCERAYCGHPVSEHNRGSKCGRCPCPLPIVDAKEWRDEAADPAQQEQTPEPPAQPRTGEGVTIRYLRERFFEEASTAKGTHCVVCDRYGKLYRRKLNVTMVTALVRLYVMHRKHPTREWFEWREFTDSRNEYEKLQLWGLIEHKPNPDDASKRDSGFWKITLLGWQFARNEVRLPQYVIVYDAEKKGEDGPMIGVEQVLDKFHYGELMKAAAGQYEATT